MTEGDTARERPPLPEPAAEAYRTRRDALRAAETEFVQALRALEDEPEAEPFEQALQHLLSTLHEHIEQADAPTGLLAEIVDTAPWLASRAVHVRGEHPMLLDRTTDLLARASAGEDVERLLGSARDLAARITEHRHHGTALLQDAYTFDVPAGD